MADITKVNKEEGTARKQKAFAPSDWKIVAAHIDDILGERKRRRAQREKLWDVVDRQIAMRPDNSHKMIPDGRGLPSAKMDPGKAWMPEIELPWQATALEILTADSRRMMFPDAGPWYETEGEMTDELLRHLENGAISMSGMETEWPSLIDQDNINKIVSGLGNHWRRQYDFDASHDATNAEAFKYGVGVARWRLARKSIFSLTASGVVEENQVIPVRVPRTIRNVYLDDTQHDVMHEGQLLGPLILECRKQKLTDLVMAATSGSDDPETFDGGWITKNVKGMEGDDNDEVEIVEAEGDIACPRKTRGSIVLRGAMVTMAVGRTGKQRDPRIVRFRWRQTRESTYEVIPYHVEDVDCAYASGILGKGAMVQLAGVDAQNRLMEVGALGAQPPLGFDKSDMEFAQSGGPNVAPGAQWATTSPVTPHQIGNLSDALQVFISYANQYSDLTGINAARLGAQTVSHTTAFAKDAELSRGTVRTVDYVRNALKGAITRGLYVEYELGQGSYTKSTIYLDPYKSFVTLEKAGVPKRAVFKAFGAAGPAEAQQKSRSRLESATQVVQLETLKVQLGGQPDLNVRALQEQMLKEGGWSDTEIFFTSDGSPGDDQAAPGGQGAAGQSPGTAIAALQALGTNAA